jgi:hypothetical protein
VATASPENCSPASSLVRPCPFLTETCCVLRTVTRTCGRSSTVAPHYRGRAAQGRLELRGWDKGRAQSRRTAECLPRGSRACMILAVGELGLQREKVYCGTCSIYLQPLTPGTQGNQHMSSISALGRFLQETTPGTIGGGNARNHAGHRFCPTPNLVKLRPGSSLIAHRSRLTM